jgi:cytoskeletal protein RodZ
MPTVAEQLRAAREAQNLTINDVAGRTKIRTDHIRAIEEGHYGIFSAPIYVRGTIKNYAAALKLDPARIVAALDAELSRSPKFAEPPRFTEPARKTILDHLTLLLAKLNWKVGLALLVVALILTFGFLVSWVLQHRTHDPLANLPPAVYQSNNAGDTLPLPTHR